MSNTSVLVNIINYPINTTNAIINTDKVMQDRTKTNKKDI